MSSATNRGKERVAFDFYPTPRWCVDRLLDRHASDLGFGREVNGPRLLEPNVGDGAIVRAVDDWIALTQHFEMEHSWTGVELRRGALAPITTPLDAHFEGVDFRSFSPWRHGLLRRGSGEFFGHPETIPAGFLRDDEFFDLALGNPPFSLAEAIIRRAMAMSFIVAMLLRVDFLGSAERVPFWAGPGANPTLRILPDRPSFDGDGTDSSTYAWFIWGAELSGPRVDVLDPTPATVRAAQKPRPPTGIPQLGFDL